MGKGELREQGSENWIFKIKERAEVNDVSRLSPFFHPRSIVFFDNANFAKRRVL